MTTTIEKLNAANTKPATATTTTGKGKSDGLDQKAFLKLMTTQLQTQDPFNPVDNTQMVAQMAQFSSVAGIAEMNSSLKSIQETLSGSRLGDAASWIGRTALVQSNVATKLSDGAFSGQITLPENATRVTLSLVNANGAEVHAQNLGAQAKGNLAFLWDGKDAQGKPVEGPLKVVVQAENAKGAVTPTVATWTQIAGVQSPAGGASTKLLTGLGLIAPDEALSLA